MRILINNKNQKEVKIKMSIIFDMYGNIIPQKIKHKKELTNEQKEIIREVRKKHNIDINTETRTYFCNIHNRFHNYLWQNKPSQTYIKCLKSGNILKFKDDYTNSELFKMSFSKNWNQEKADYYKNNKK